MKSYKRNKSTKTGATSTMRSRRAAMKLPWRRVFPILLSCVAISIVVALSALGLNWLKQTSVQKIENVAVTADFSLLSRGEVTALLNSYIKDEELRISLHQLRQELQNISWVEQAAVHWQWPATLEITLVEQIPIARWGRLGFLNQRGEVVQISDPSVLPKLPLLIGPSGSENLVMQNFQQLNQLLRMSELQIAELRCDQLLNWRMVLSNGVHVVIGRDQVMEKVQRFLVVFRQGLQQRMDNIVSVDLRYDNGVAVGWDDPMKKNAQEEHMQLARLSER